jgi:hypothetical protein
LRVVFDACLPHWLVDSLFPIVQPRCRVDHVTRLYGAGIKDPEWIGELTKEGGAVFITFDRHLRTRPVEVRALLASACVGIVLAPQWQDDDDPIFVARLLLHWHLIVDAAGIKTPAMFELPWSLRPRPLRQWRGWDKIASRVGARMQP